MLNSVIEIQNYLEQYSGVDFLGGTATPSLALAKLEFFSSLIANPEQNLNIIHVAGTSGKGSFCTILAKSLNRQGFSTGHCLSPHLLQLNERFQINSKPIDDQKLIKYFNQIYPILEQFQSGKKANNYPPLSYFEIITSLQFYIFDKENLAYIILETGMGGRLDATNIAVPSKICILNAIGLDHTRWLGNTLELIATEKAGIIQKNNIVIALSQSKPINQVFAKAAEIQDAEIDFVIPNFDFDTVRLSQEFTTFNYTDQELVIHQIHLGLIGKFQATNCALAIRTLEEISQKDDWQIDWKILVSALKTIKFPGRFEIISVEQKVYVLDGAHNAQKITAFLESYFQIFDSETNQKPNLVLAFKADKDYKSILDVISSYKSQIGLITLTSFGDTQDSKIKSKEPIKVQTYMLEIGFENVIDILTVQQILEKNRFIEQNQNLIFTGSLHLVGDVLESLNSKK